MQLNSNQMFILQNILLTLPVNYRKLDFIFLDENGLFYYENSNKIKLDKLKNYVFYFVSEELKIEVVLDWTPEITYQYLKGKDYTKRNLYFRKYRVKVCD